MLRLALSAVVLAGAAGPALALEKAPARAPDAPEFVAGTTVEIAYFNVCTGWVWNWSGAPPLATYGVFYHDPGPEDDRLLRTHVFYAQGAPAGYGYTSIARAMGPFEPRCPDGLLDFAFFLPQTGWNTIVWNGDQGIPVEDFFVLVSHSPEPGNPTVIVTEKGEGGGARPGGCGTCYDADREPFSFQFGQEDVIVCPGLPWHDDSACPLELVWRSDVRLGSPTSVAAASWGKVKSLYR